MSEPLATNSSSRGHDVSVATMRHKDQPAFEMDQGVRVYRVRSSVQHLPWLFSNSGRQYPPPFPDPEIMLELHSVLEKERPEIVHAHNWLVRSFLPLKARSKARLVVTLHDYNFACARVDLMYYGTIPVVDQDCKMLELCFQPLWSCAWRAHGFEQLGHESVRTWHHRSLYCRQPGPSLLGTDLARGHIPFLVIPNFIADDPAFRKAMPAPYLAQLPARKVSAFRGWL